MERGTMSKASRPSLELESAEIVDDGVVVFEPINSPIELTTTVVVVVVMIPETVELDWVVDCVEAWVVVPWVVPMNLMNKKKFK